MADHTERLEILKTIEEQRGSKAILYVTGDRPGLETQIAKDVHDIFVDHLDAIGPTEKISLILHTNGGDTAAAWRLVNLLHIFSEKLEVIIPSKSLSSGTIIALGADNIVMTKQAVLGPIDPSVNSPMNPQIPGAAPNAKYPVSVEAVQGYLNIATEELGMKSDDALAQIFTQFSNQVHPLILGQIYRSRSQIRLLGTELLKKQVKDSMKIDQIVSFLCSETGSHDYTINRREAKNLGLNIENPTQEFYGIVKSLYGNFTEDMELRNPLNPVNYLDEDGKGDYQFTRLIVESTAKEPDHFVSKGTFTRVDNQPAPNGLVTQLIQDNREFEGWIRL
ncbi:SDH family Clp fold serine proteinase [Kiloniella antarctica]|uniref:Serine protease n=1 Tax=Kiloniella antarctica TaxID=1550907 RepID=A0ABW5BMV7_9PROT